MRPLRSSARRLCLLAALAAGRAVGADLPPGFELRWTPISGGLGLGDVALRAPESAAGGAAVRLALRAGGQAEVAMRAEDVPGSTPRSRLFTARVMAGEGPDSGRVRFSILLRDAARGVPDVLGPFAMPASPGAGRSTPDWAKGAVWYQVFPERFRNGEPANDPRGPEFFAARWTSDWRALGVEEIEAARARVAMQPPHEHRALPDARSAAIQARRFGGDLQGLTEKLDELADLGVTAVYLNPVFHAHSHHKYDATDFRHVDPALAGDVRACERPDETEDPATWVWTRADRYVLDTLLPAARERGLRIVFDGVWNHVGTRFWAFEDVRRRGRASPYAPWFQGEFADDDPNADARLAGAGVRPGALVGWASWNGRNGSLPTFARGADGRLHEGVERHVFEVTRRWMAPDGGRGVDGWRLDVAPDLPRPFWEAWCAHARSLNPDALLIGEYWFDAREFFSTDESTAVFDGQMNYPFAMPVVRWLGDVSYPAGRLGAQLAALLSRPPQHELVHMNMLASHDTARLATMLHAGAAGVREYNAPTPSRLRGRRPDARAYDLVVLGVALQVAWPGAPMVYYGDEYGMHGERDPHCRKPLPWPDLGPMDNPADAPDPALRERFRAWLRLRHDPAIGPALRYGDCRVIDTPSPDVFAVERGLNGLRVLVIANRADEPFDARAVLDRWETAADTSAVRMEPHAGSRGTVVPPRSAAVFALGRPE
jgi:glycosidase